MAMMLTTSTASQLEDAVLNSARNSDMKDLSDHSAVPAKPSEADMNLQPRIVQADNQNDTRRHTADQRSQRRACHAPVESKYKQNISRHIDDIHDDGRLHGNPGISMDRNSAAQEL